MPHHPYEDDDNDDDQESAPLPRYRWHAIVSYRADAGTLDVCHDLEELYELHDRIEHGPHWDTVERIVITRSGYSWDAELTVEEAERL
jgi:hypothetical protein